MKTVGVALGGGGARGLAHIVVLEALEELGITPCVVAGTSIGAVIGAGLAAGLSTAEMRRTVEEIRTLRRGRFWNIYEKSDLNLLLAFIDPTRETGGLLKGDKFLEFLRSKIGVDRFEDLSIPLKIIATDYWRKEEVVLENGDLFTAIHASYALPGLFTPVRQGTKLLVDGGLMNPLPYDVIRPHCDISVAVDVSADPVADRNQGHNPADAQSTGRAMEETPRAYEVFFVAFQIMQVSIVREKLNHSLPDVLVKTNIKDVRTLEFNKHRSIFEQALPARDELKHKLEEALRKIG